MNYAKRSSIRRMELTKPRPPKDEEFEALKSGLNNYNERVTGPVFNERISSFVKNDSGVVVGGILAEINWGWMHIQGLWVEDSFREKGWGFRLIDNLESYALSKGIHNVRLETTTFQALDFYLKLGYSIFGELSDMPLGHTSYFLTKKLTV